MTVQGHGEEQQLYCPGTIDHSHKLTFQLERGIPPSNPYVPLSYTMIDQRKFFKREDKEIDIDKILESIQEPPKQLWPFVGEEYADIAWNAVGQPDTSIRVRVNINTSVEPGCLGIYFDINIENFYIRWS